MFISLQSFGFAAEGNPTLQVGLHENMDATVDIGPYASVMAQKLEYHHLEIKWSWANHRPVIEHYWDNQVEPGMDFGQYSGKAGFGKFTDSNGFVLETNTALNLVFSGMPLTHTIYPDSKMLTTYWAWTAEGVDDNVWPVPNWEFFPAQVRPANQIGYFGQGNIPRYDGGFAHNDVLSGLLHLLHIINVREIWPEQSQVMENLSYNGIETNGIYAFQVFGFAGTDDISSQREGSYVGSIMLTVAAQ